MTASARAAAAGAALLVAAVWLPTLRHHLLLCDDLTLPLVAADRLHAGRTLAPHTHYRPVGEMALVGLWEACRTEGLPYRAALVGLHLLNGWLTFRLGRACGLSPAGAGLGTALFLVASVHRETVMWTTCIPQVMGGTGALAGALLVVRGWLWGRRAAVTAAVFLAGILSYPFGLLLAVAAAAAWREFHAERPFPRRLVVVLAALALAWVACEWLVPVLRMGTYPHLKDVSREPVVAAAAALRNLAGSAVYPWLPDPLVGRLTGWLPAMLKAAGAAVAAAALVRTWRTGPGGRWLVLWTALAAFPFFARAYVDGRMLYPIAAGTALALGGAAAAVPGMSGTAVRVVLAAVIVLNAWVLRRWAEAYRDAGEQTDLILAAVRAAAPQHRPGGLLVVRGFPRWVGHRPWLAPQMIYTPGEILSWTLGDRTADVRGLGPNERLPDPGRRSMVVIERDRVLAGR